jgi:hypothetical protein
MKKEVADLLNTIQEARKALESIQSNCQHLNHEVCWYSYRVGQMAPNRICMDCNLPIPGITDQEASDFREKEYKKMGFGYRDPITGHTIFTKKS